MHDHSGVHGGDALSDGATTAMTRRPLPWLRLRQWVLGEVEEVMAERCARAIGQWRGGGSERARQRCGGNGAALWFAQAWRGLERGEVEASESERGGRARE